MELMQRDPMSRDNSYDIISGNSSSPWYRNRRIMWIVVAAIALLAALALFLGGFFSGIGADKDTNSSARKAITEEPIMKIKDFSVLPPIQWNGVCPQKGPKCPTSFQDNPPVIMISLDGFRPDYLERSFAETIKNISECGTKASFMYPVFPTKTFPNHFSQVTGLNPSSHGIIDNEIYDQKKGKRFKVGKTDILEPFWWQKEPIWVTAVKQGKKSACFYWPGSEAKINGSYPTYYKKYSSRMPFEERVDQVLKWLDMPVETRPSYITLYVNEPDHASHYYGITSNEVNQALKKVDNMIARLFSGLQQRNIIGCVNVIITSDHGMSDTDCSRVIDIQKLVDVSSVYSVLGPFGRLRPKGYFNKTAINEVVSSLKCRSKHMRAYPKQQLPIRVHFSANQRIEPIFLDLDAGWTVVRKDVKKTDDGICSGGAHGYDNLFPDMRAIFIAHGPSFKQGYTSEPFINTELYEMLCELLNISPNPNNGTRGSLHHIMTSPRFLPAQAILDAPITAEVPKEETEYNFRVYAANCSSTQTIKPLEINDNVLKEKRSLHMPFGIPFDAEDNNTLRLLYNEDYVSAFDIKYRIPMWSSFTLTGLKNVAKQEDILWKGDPRILMQETSQCTDYNSSPVKKHFILQRPLYPPSFSSPSTQEEATFVTNSIPKSMNHTHILEKEFNQMLTQRAAENELLNVVMGPAFDFAENGMRPHIGKIMRSHENTGPLIVPTHIFAIATWCSDKVKTFEECDGRKLKTLAYLLPNLPYLDNCETPSKTIEKNVARVVDIENLTGIKFFSGLSVYDAIRLRTMIPEAINL